MVAYRLKMWRFFFSGVLVTISNCDSLSSRETSFIKTLFLSLNFFKAEKRYTDWAWCQKALGGIYLTDKWRTETLQPGLESDNIKPRLICGLFKCISWLNGSFFFFLWWSVFSENGSQDLSKSPLNAPTFFLSSHLWSIVGCAGSCRSLRTHYLKMPYPGIMLVYSYCDTSSIQYSEFLPRLYKYISYVAR